MSDTIASAAFDELAEVLDLLVIGLPIEVQVPMPDPDMTNVYFSQIIDRSEKGLHISAPQHRGQQVDILLDGDLIYLRFSHLGVAYTCECRMLGWQHRPEGMLVSLPQQVERVQRRHFVRVDATLPVSLTLLGDGLADRVLRTRTTDLSGGGMMITSARELPLYGDAEVHLTLPSDSGSAVFDTLALQAQICRSVKGERDYHVGLCFMNIDEKLRDRLIRYIFRLERELLQSKAHLDL